MFTKSSRSNTVKPVARTEGLSVTTSGDETLVYDRISSVIHRLDGSSAAVWRMADGTRSLEALSADSGVNDVEQALGKLHAIGLMQGETTSKSGFSRRFLIGGAAGAAAAGTFMSASALFSKPSATCVQSEWPDGWGPVGQCGQDPNSRWICQADGTWFCVDW